jgi:hypothetical protein
MARIIEEVAVLISADTRALNKGMKETQKRVSVLTRSFKRLGGALIVAFGARAVFNRFKSALRFTFQTLRATVDETNKLITTAKGVGFTTDEYGRLLFMLKRVGVGAQAARIALGDLQKRLGRTNFQKFFRQFGLDPKALAKVSRAEQLDIVLKKLVELRDAGVDIAGITGLLFEEQAGKDILKLVLQYERGLEARKDYERIVGKGTTKQDEKELLELTASIGNLELAWTQLKRKIVFEVAPDVTEAILELTDNISIQEFTDDVLELARAFTELAKDIKFVLELVPKAAKAALPLPVRAIYKVAKVPFKGVRKARLIAEPPDAFRRRFGDPLDSTTDSLDPETKPVDVSIIQNFHGIPQGDMPHRAGRAAQEGVNRAAEAPGR